MNIVVDNASEYHYEICMKSEHHRMKSENHQMKSENHQMKSEHHRMKSVRPRSKLESELMMIDLI